MSDKIGITFVKIDQNYLHYLSLNNYFMIQLEASYIVTSGYITQLLSRKCLYLKLVTVHFIFVFVLILNTILYCLMV